MTQEEIDVRLLKLESIQSFQSHAIEEQSKDNKEIKASLNEIKTSIALLTQISNTAANVPSLEPRVRLLEDSLNKTLPSIEPRLRSLEDLSNKILPSLEPRVRTLEDNSNRIAGGYKVVATVFTIIGGVLGAIVSYLYHH